MSPAALLKEAADFGLRVSLNGDRLALKAGSPPSPELLARLKSHKAEVIAFLRDAAREPASVDVEERAAMAAGAVADRYLDAWARFQLRPPYGIDEARWRQAVDDAGRFLDTWGSLASEFGWLSGHIFDVPRDGCMGLACFLEGETVRSLGPEHAITKSGRV